MQNNSIFSGFIFIYFYKERSFRFSALKPEFSTEEPIHTLDTNQIRRWLISPKKTSAPQICFELKFGPSHGPVNATCFEGQGKHF